MAQVIVRNIEADVKLALKKRASRHGWSMEEEVRQILRRAVSEERQTRPKLGSRIVARFAGAGLTVALPELHGEAVEPMSFGSCAFIGQAQKSLAGTLRPAPKVYSCA